MDGFSGIRPEAIWLLAENRFHDSREFYEEHKAQLKTQIVEPLRRLVEDLAPAALKIDPQIIANPMQNGCVSRIRRDNRYTRDKSLYRENMWIVLMRDKKAWDALPAFFADFSPRGTNFGMGVYHESPRLMQILRRHLEENPEPFRRRCAKPKRRASPIRRSLCPAEKGGPSRGYRQSLQPQVVGFQPDGAGPHLLCRSHAAGYPAAIHGNAGAPCTG